MKKIIYILFILHLAQSAFAQNTAQPIFKYLGKLAQDPPTCSLETPVKYFNTVSKRERFCARTDKFEYTTPDGKLVGSFAKASLPTLGVYAGDRVRVTDSTRGIWRYDGAKWIPEDAGRRINILDFCDSAAVNNSPCLQSAIGVLESGGGGTIVFPAGYTFKLAAQINMLAHHGITFEGTNSNSEENGTTTNIECTMAGSTPCFSMPSMHGVGRKC